MVINTFHELAPARIDRLRKLMAAS